MLKKILSLLSDVAVYGISSLLSQVIGLLLLPLYTRYLTPGDYYAIAMLTLVASLFGPLGNLGMVNAIFRRFNLDKREEERGRVLASALCSVVVSSTVLLVVGCIFAAPIAEAVDLDASLANLVRLSLLTAMATTCGAVALAILRADRRVKTTAVVNVAKLLVSAGCTIWLVVVEQMGVEGVVIGTLVGETTMMLVQFAVTLRAFRFAPDPATWRRLITYGLPFVPHQLQALGMALFGQYMVGRMLGDVEGGLYAIAVRFALPVAFVVNAVQAAWVPFKYQIHAEDENPADFFRAVVTYYVAGILYLWVGVSLWGPELVWLMTTAPFHDAAWLVPTVGFIPVAQGLYFMMGTGIELSDNTRPYPLVTFAGLVTIVAGSYPLVRLFGAAGAALAAIAAWLVVTVAIYALSQRRIVIRYDWPILLLLAALAAGAVEIGYVNLGLPLAQRLVLAAAISLAFPLLEFVVLSRSSTERHRMRILLTKFRLAPFTR